MRPAMTALWGAGADWRHHYSASSRDCPTTAAFSIWAAVQAPFHSSWQRFGRIAGLLGLIARPTMSLLLGTECHGAAFSFKQLMHRACRFQAAPSIRWFPFLYLISFLIQRRLSPKPTG